MSKRDSGLTDDRISRLNNTFVKSAGGKPADWKAPRFLHFTPVDQPIEPRKSQRGRHVTIDLGDGEVWKKFHDMRDGTHLTGSKLLLQMVEFCIMSNETAKTACEHGTPKGDNCVACNCEGKNKDG